jgi:hypothetical protein
MLAGQCGTAAARSGLAQEQCAGHVVPSCFNRPFGLPFEFRFLG